MAAIQDPQAPQALKYPLTDEQTMTAFVPEPSSTIEEIETRIMKHPRVVALLKNSEFGVSRPHLRASPSIRAKNFTAGMLEGPDGIPTPPLAFVRPDGSEYYSFLYLGAGLCGHPGYVHGGLMATLLDEGLAGAAFPALPSKMGVTATLTLEYKAPCKVDQYVMIRAATEKVEGRKAWVKGTLELLTDGEDEPPVVFSQATALFIDPMKPPPPSAN